jgi:hypothetical protein
MEVHHHPDLHHRKKNVKEYLLEFLMIFLAVTMGFFAETIRERISEKHLERDYIIGLINNAESDTAQLRGLISRNESLLRGIDSLLSISRVRFTERSVQDSLYYYALAYTFTTHIFKSDDLTLVQLRNAGGYSRIKTTGVADSIALYESKNKEIQIQERFYIDNAAQTWAAFKQVFDGTQTKKFFAADSANNRIPADFDVLISPDKEKMAVLLNDYWSYSGTIYEYNIELQKQLDYLKNFVRFLKERYDVD